MEEGRKINLQGNLRKQKGQFFSKITIHLYEICKIGSKR